MIPLRIANATHIFVAPKGEEQVRSLHVRVIDGCCVSRWEPTSDKPAILNNGGSVELWIRGHQPPVSLVVQPHIQEHSV